MGFYLKVDVFQKNVFSSSNKMEALSISFFFFYFILFLNFT